jgi:putative oxidoreductase
MASNLTSPTGSLSAVQINFALLLVRFGCGTVFIYHGAGILFGSFGGPGPVAFASGMHAPALVGYLVGLAQFGGGLAVLTGILTRVGAACVAIVMIGAILMVHWPHGYNIAKGGMEYALTELFLALALLVAGAGNYSLGAFLPAGLRKL